MTSDVARTSSESASIFGSRADPRASTPLLAVAALTEIARAHAAESERLRTLAPEVVVALRASGLLGFVVPPALGGGGHGPRVQFEVVEAMARVDTAAAWCLMISAMESGMAGAYLPDDGAQEVFQAGIPSCAGLLMPSGKLLPVAGGFRAHGRWAFGSGIRHADWIVTSAVAPSEPPGSRPIMCTIVVPAASVVIEDTWHAAGLRGSGSEHYRLEDVFVPEERSFSFPAAPALRGGPWFDLPFTALLAPVHAGFALGAARAALDAVCTLAAQRTKLWSGVALGTHAAFQMELGRAQAKLCAARAFGLEVAEMLEERSAGQHGLTPADWSSVRIMVAHATEISTEVATFAFRAGGASALYESSPLQRIFRDLQAASQHIAASDEAYEYAGQVSLGVATPHPLLSARPARV